jgi:hypothetical protein
VSKNTKTGQLQIRVSNAQKLAIQRAAAKRGKDMSTYVLCKVLPAMNERFDELVRALPIDERFALAELNTFLTSLTSSELREAVAIEPVAKLPAYLANYVAAMVELACARSGVEVPKWASDVPVLNAPVFGSKLKSIRLHLLRRSPQPFRRRNIFIDSSLGDQV